MEWRHLHILLLTVFLIGSAPALAEKPAPQPYALAIVIGGGRSEADAKRSINDFKSVDAAKVKPADGFPKILSSDDVPGSPPDTYLAILGYCEASSSAALVKKMVHAISSGAYSMPVAGKFDNACPTLAPELKDEAKPPPSANKKRDRSGY